MSSKISKYDISQKMETQIENSFTYHSPKDDQPDRYVYLRNNALQLAILILGNVPVGREQSLAITKLEECIMWANKGIACGEP